MIITEYILEWMRNNSATGPLMQEIADANQLDVVELIEFMGAGILQFNLYANFETDHVLDEVNGGPGYTKKVIIGLKDFELYIMHTGGIFEVRIMDMTNKMPYMKKFFDYCSRDEKLLEYFKKSLRERGW